jgi:catechol 2,3-dioxygenase-like lactoylglutathione lyase family enzyme
VKPSVPEILDAFDRGKLSRRELLIAMTAALAAPAIASAQGAAQGRAGGDSAGRGGRGGRGQAQRDTTPLVLPFEATGWKTVWLDHFDYTCTDYKKAAAWYATVMGWKVRSDDGKQCTLDIGENSGSVVIRGGLAAPPPAAITDAGLGVTRPPITAIWDGYAWGIEPWDRRTVEAELKKRGLNPVADHRGDYESFKFKDPDGFNVAVTNGTKANRRRRPANGKLPAPAPFEPTGWETLYLDHISFEVWDYRRSAAFYKALLGWDARTGGGGQASVRIGDNGVVGGAIIRGNAAARAAGRGAAGDSSRGGAPAPLPASPPPGAAGAAIGHISFGIKDWNTERVKAELIKRDVVYVNREGVKEPRPDMTGNLLSFHVPDAMGWDLQIGNKIGDTEYGGRGGQ